MQFQVPQYIEVEDKIVGPLTITQFLYLGSAFLFAFITYFFLAPWLWIFVSGIAGLCAAALAFARYHGRPLIAIIVAAIRYFREPRAYMRQKPGESIAPPQSLLARLGLALNTSKTGFSSFKRAIAPEEKFEILRRISGDREVARRIDYR